MYLSGLLARRGWHDTVPESRCYFLSLVRILDFSFRLFSIRRTLVELSYTTPLTTTPPLSLISLLVH